MTLPADVLRAVAHGLIDVTAASIVLALVALAVTRVPGIDAAARSRWWSAVLIIPLLAFVVALAQPVMVPKPANADEPYAGRYAALIDPLDALLRRGEPAAPAAQRTLSATSRTVALAAPGRPVPFPWLPAALALWLAVAAVRVAAVLASVVRAHRIAVTASGAETLATWGAAASAARADAVAARVALRVRDDVAMPVAIGLMQRTVIVPSQLAASLPAPELRAVVLHEIAHLRRCDDWTFLFERLACAVLWFDPVVYLAARASATWREIACDASAAHEAGARTCATALWRSASVLRTRRRPALALLSGGTLVDRVEALLRPSATSRTRTAAATIALLLFASSASTVVVVRAPAYASPASSASTESLASRGLIPTGSMHTRRASFAMVKLRGGRILVAGGMIANHDFTGEAEIYDPARGTFEPAGSLRVARTGLTGTLLRDGRVLLAGGWTTAGITQAAELYDPQSRAFSATSALHTARAGHTATLLGDGMVLFTGGSIGNGTATAAAELYDPRTGAFTEIAPMHEPRVAHTATLLADGRILIAGGLDGQTSLRATELYDPAARRFTAGPPMLEPRSKHASTLLADGSVLMTGGGATNAWSSRLFSAERYEPRANRFVPAGAMNAKRFKLAQSTVRLANGNVLVAGGSDHVELYDAARDSFSIVQGSMSSARNLGAAVLLDDGSVLIAGGYDSVDPLPTTETALLYRT